MASTTAPPSDPSYDIEFFWDPVCPFAWITSRWVDKVVAQRGMRVDWRFISLRLVNADVDYAAHFPPEYEAGHTAGLRLLRVAARTRAEHGRDAVGQLYEALGARIFDAEFVPDTAQDHGVRGTRPFVEPVLAAVGLPAELADALDDAGCTDADVVGHLRGPGPHARGCWVVDLLLGKS